MLLATRSQLWLRRIRLRRLRAWIFIVLACRARFELLWFHRYLAAGLETPTMTLLKKKRADPLAALQAAADAAKGKPTS